MWECNSNRKCAWKRRPFILLLSGLILLPAVHPQALMTPPPPRCANAQQCLARGMFYYNNDDINDNASQHFNLIISRFSRSSKELAQARYYLASYYQRKYYIQKHRLRKDDRRVLELAAAKYGEFVNNYKAGSSQWLADAFFNQALAYLQLGDSKRAYDEMYNMREAKGRDGSVYIYEIVWSPRPEDVVDSYVPTESLGNFGMGLVSGKPYGPQQVGVPDSFEQKVLVLRRWCQSQKSRSYK